MRVSLRKANALQEALAEAVKSSTKTQREVDVLNTVMWKPEINNVQTRYFDEIRGKLDMVNVRFTIRQLVSTANAESGVSDLLTELASTDSAIITIQRFIVQQSAREKDEILEKKRERKLARVDNPEYDGYMEMEVSVISKEDRDHWEDKVKELRRRKATINDQLLELNIRTDIELPTFVEEVLRKENLIGLMSVGSGARSDSYHMELFDVSQLQPIEQRTKISASVKRRIFAFC